MAITVWDGSDLDNDFATEANWDTAAKPVAGDEVIFDGRTTEDCTGSMAHGNTGNVNFDLIHIKSSFTGDVGVAGAPLHHAADIVIIEGSGSYYIETSNVDAASDATTALVIVNNPGRNSISFGRCE